MANQAVLFLCWRQQSNHCRFAVELIRWSTLNQATQGCSTFLCFCTYITFILAGGTTGLYHLVTTHVSLPNMGCISCWKYVLRSLCCALKLVLSSSPGNIYLGTRGLPPVVCLYILAVPGITLCLCSQGSLRSSGTCSLMGPCCGLMGYSSTEHGVRTCGCGTHNGGLQVFTQV